MNIPYKKITFEDKFIRMYTNIPKNNNKAMKFYKKRNRKALRRVLNSGAFD